MSTNSGAMGPGIASVGQGPGVTAHQTSLKERLIGLLPTLCLIHCIGTALIGSVMPAAALWMHNPWLEGVLSLLSALLIGTLVLRRRAGLDLLTGLFLATLGIGIVGWVGHIDFLRHGSLLLLVGVQLLWLRQRRSQHSHDHDAAHCEAEGHGHPVAKPRPSQGESAPAVRAGRPGEEFA